MELYKLLKWNIQSKAINAIVPYSAQIFKVSVSPRRMKENPVRYTGKIALGIVAPTVAIWLCHATMTRIEDNGKPT